MIGAVIGDIAGSIYEFNNHRSKDFELISEKCHFTDDSILTLAVAEAIAECRDDVERLGPRVTELMRQIGRHYPGAGWGGRFFDWLFGDDPRPYNSLGNGSAMRVSAAGWAARSIGEAKDLSRRVTEVTHNHPEGILGAEATAVAVFLAREGRSPAEIGAYVNEHYYKLDFTCDSIRDTYRFNAICRDTVPQAVEAFVEARDFEDAIRNAISIGGDSDTLAAITGAIAEACFGVPTPIRAAAEAKLDERLAKILFHVEQVFPPTAAMKRED